ncbi:cell division ATP-binding protein FtsE [Thiohalocapsa marina]|uniref:cell division ATP-binding protein FtsE n=1 Tax=Thiohalocapsa marina TaxID=424902 RepID=UPI0036DCDE4A
MIRFEHVTKRYAERGDALRDVSFTLEPGEMAFLTGHSGAGKSTLLRLIGLLERPTRGRLSVAGQDLGALGRRQIPLHRRRVGMIFQDHRLLPDRNVFDNVSLPLLAAGMHPRELGKRVRAALDQVGLLRLEHALPTSLSSGEQQRVGIARAVVARPPVILADEPTAPLDSTRAMAVVRILNDMAAQFQTAIIVVTHDEKIIPTFKRIYHIRDGVTHEEAGEGRSVGG